MSLINKEVHDFTVLDNAFVFLASDETSYITGVALSVDGMART